MPHRGDRRLLIEASKPERPCPPTGQQWRKRNRRCAARPSYASPFMKPRLPAGEHPNRALPHCQRTDCTPPTEENTRLTFARRTRLLSWAKSGTGPNNGDLLRRGRSKAPKFALQPAAPSSEDLQGPRHPDAVLRPICLGDQPRPHARPHVSVRLFYPFPFTIIPPFGVIPSCTTHHRRLHCQPRPARAKSRGERIARQ